MLIWKFQCHFERLPLGARPRRDKCVDGFTLVELLAVVAVVGILAALLLPVLVGAKTQAQRTTCLGNLKQINLGFIQYAGANGDALPGVPDMDAHGGPDAFAFFYKPLVMNDVGLLGAPSPQDKLFHCPADTFFYDRWTGYVAKSAYHQPETSYSSYAYNALNGSTNSPPTLPDQTAAPGLMGRRLSSIRDPVRTVLVAELSAFVPWSWHKPQLMPAGQKGINNAMNMVSFADGHLNYIKIYWNADYGYPSAFYDPPAGYDYKWSAD